MCGYVLLFINCNIVKLHLFEFWWLYHLFVNNSCCSIELTSLYPIWFFLYPNTYCYSLGFEEVFFFFSICSYVQLPMKIILIVYVNPTIAKISPGKHFHIYRAWYIQNWSKELIQLIFISQEKCGLYSYPPLWKLKLKRHHKKMSTLVLVHVSILLGIQATLQMFLMTQNTLDT